MAKCEACGNDYDKSFQVVVQGRSHVFDSFECAIHTLAPACAHCGVRIVGHGLEKNGRMFCCAHCAQGQGVTQLKDRVWRPSGGAAPSCFGRRPANHPASTDPG